MAQVGLVRVFAQRPWIAGIFCSAYVIGFARLAILAERDVRALPSAPQQVSITDALASIEAGGPRTIWVTLTDGVPMCGMALHEESGSRRYVPLREPSGAMRVVAAFDGPTPCAGPVTGMLRKTDSATARSLDDGGFVPTSGPLYDLCTG